jgi:hypothetical protein
VLPRTPFGWEHRDLPIRLLGLAEQAIILELSRSKEKEESARSPWIDGEEESVRVTQKPETIYSQHSDFGNQS